MPADRLVPRDPPPPKPSVSTTYDIRIPQLKAATLSPAVRKMGLHARAARVPDDRAHDLEGAIEEIALNALNHGGATTANIRLRVEPGQVEAILEDNGRAFDTATAAETAELPEEIGDSGGTGLVLVQTYVDKLYWHRRVGRNETVATIFVQERNNAGGEPAPFR